MTSLERVAAVSYLNTVPFIYGIEHARLSHADLLLSPPSGCVASFVDRRAEIALIPSAALSTIKGAEIVTSYCLGAHNPVRTVVILSNDPIGKIRRLWLDPHSRTSVLLSSILCDELWNLSPQRLDLGDYSAVAAAREGDAFLLIGDKVFDYEGTFRYSYDLADCWRQMTGMPFVFAVWVAYTDVERARVDALQASLAYGVEHISEAIAYYGHSGKPYALDYLTNNIDYVFDEQKRGALSLFLEKGRKFLRRTNPG